LPTTQQANEEISKVLPKYATEHRPEDYWTETALTELPLIAATGGLSSASAFGKSVLSSLGRLGGSEVGRIAGGRLGQVLGDREIGEAVGGIAGGAAGSLGTHALLNRPSKVLPSKILEAEKSAFEAEKSANLAEKTKEYHRAAREVPIEKRKFETAKNNKIKTVSKEITGYENKIKELEKSRKPLYDKATKLEGKSLGSANKLIDTANKISKDIKIGVAPEDRIAIGEHIKSLKKIIKKGELSLSDAKRLKINLNDQKYNYQKSPGFKHYTGELVEGLKEFISENGTPEHNAQWKKAEAAHIEFNNLKKEKSNFVKEKHQEIRDIKQEKLSPEREHFLKIDAQNAKKQLEEVRKGTYEKLLKSNNAQDKILKAIEGSNKGKSFDYGKAGLGAFLGYVGGFGKIGTAIGGLAGKLFDTASNEYRIAQDVIKNHPEIFNEYKSLIKDAVKNDAPKIAKSISEIGQKIEKYNPVQEERKGRFKIVD
jgi:hypothetical protein